ncbi:sensor domain-containing protein [Catenulispora sp. NL8]|uniref:Sensor domain-containing protein n=1 Tax=Catenulispora pinistramenti TaxID=2705254 RepID=A0ABS5KW73_9ACTN|nr:sensor domain-containing protein [Catenulispora pinistramenti]MBS2550215.1 sensor domain-containing protein [Catenulispora pinistramenti]
MRIRIKYGSAVAVTTAAVLLVAACGASGKSASTASPGSGHSAAALTDDQVDSLLLTDKDQPGYYFDASLDVKSTTDSPALVTAGGSECQSFRDAENALSTKYGTTVDTLRILTANDGPGMIQDAVQVMPSTGKASALMSDLTAGLKGCRAFTETEQNQPVPITLTAISQMVGADRVGYTTNANVQGSTLVTATYVVRVGPAVVSIMEVETAKNGVIPQPQAEATLVRLSDVQVGRLKSAEGVG